MCIAFTFVLVANALRDSSTASKVLSLSLLSAVVIISMLLVAGARSDFCHQSCTEEPGKYSYFWFFLYFILVAFFFLWWMRRRLARQGNFQNQTGCQGQSQDQAGVRPTHQGNLPNNAGCQGQGQDQGQDQAVRLTHQGNFQNQMGKTYLIIISVLISYWDEDGGGYARAGLLQLFGSIDSVFRTVINNSPAVAAFNTKFQAVLANCFNFLLPVFTSYFAQLSNQFLAFFADLKLIRGAVFVAQRLLAVVYQMVRALAEFSVFGLLINNWKICVTCWCIGLICSFQQDENLPYPNPHLGLPGH
jgi:hypothetical protein